MKKFIKENWSKIVIVVIVIILVSLTSKFLKTNPKPIPTAEPISEDVQNIQTANPASVNCIEKGGKISIVDNAEGQVGMCTLSDGTVCEEWAYFRGECTDSSPIPGTEKAIQAFLANKYKKPISEVKVVIQKEAPGFAAGSVSFDQDGQGEGGMWLAVAGNQWDVVWDGNGAVDCNKMRQQYGFPDSILKPNFCD